MYRLKDGFIVRKIGKQIMAVPVGSRTTEVHGIIALSESGALLWAELEKGAEKEALVSVLTENYEVEYSTALSDVETFLGRLKEQGVLQ